MDVKFHDEEGNEYLWFPKWDDLRNLYAEAERVEDMNPTGDEDLERLKELKQLDDAVIDEISDIIADTWVGDDLGDFFRQLGHDVDYGYQIEENARTFPAETGGPDRVRKRFVANKLRELNEVDYELVVKVIEKAASQKEHIGMEYRRETVVSRLDEVVKHEGWTITQDGNIQPIQYNGENK